MQDPPDGILAVSLLSQPLPMTPHGLLFTQPLGAVTVQGILEPAEDQRGPHQSNVTLRRPLTEQTTSPSSRDRSEWENAYEIPLPKNSNLNLLTLIDPPTKVDKGQRTKVRGTRERTPRDPTNRIQATESPLIS